MCIYGGICGFAVKYVGLWWNICLWYNVYLWWNMLVCGEIYGFVMEYMGLWWNMWVFGGICRFVVEYVELWWDGGDIRDDNDGRII